jgi:uncharacterized protein YceK
MTRAVLLALGLMALAGCQSMRSWQEGCAGIYSGVRYYREQTPELPFDGRVFFTFDLLPTTLLDTLALPVTAFVDPKQPSQGYALGCRWAGSRSGSARSR